MLHKYQSIPEVNSESCKVIMIPVTNPLIYRAKNKIKNPKKYRCIFLIKPKHCNIKSFWKKNWGTDTLCSGISCFNLKTGFAEFDNKI